MSYKYINCKVKDCFYNEKGLCIENIINIDKKGFCVTFKRRK